ncbi:MAG: BamA/TamA family outer membrane protein [Phaeodactylibacter sp.]|uniref:translocation and assembly module lipoprotein TamL n=1 Tax=Phaeodactylibacter sp. TaxID=1940289 RepID=UPI0032EBFB02
MTRNLQYMLGTLAFLLLGSSCQPTRTLQDGQSLYTGTQLQYTGPKAAVSTTALESAIGQEPNQYFLGLPIRLGIYNATAKKEGKLGKWVQRKLGEPPVIFDYQEAETSRLRLEKRLIDQGYLQARVGMDTLQKEKRVETVFRLSPGDRYTIKGMDWPASNTDIGQFIQAAHSEQSEWEGVPYQTQRLSEERDKLANSGNENGFYGLNPRHLYYFLDTTDGQHQVQAFLRLAEAPTGNPYQKHYIGKTNVYPVYYLEEPEWTYRDTLAEDGISFFQNRAFIKPKVLGRTILQEEGDLYVQSLQQKSTNRLMGLGAYKFVNLKMQLREAGDSLFLDRSFYLTPSLTQDFSAELEISSLSTASSSLNGGVNLNYAHHNLFGGAERFNIELSTSIATQIGESVDFINSYNIGLETSLRFPGMLTPFNWLRGEQAWQSSTTAQLRGDFQRRTNNFSLFSLSGSYGFDWQPGRLHRYTWKPVQLTRTRLLSSTDQFDERLAGNSRLRASFEDNLILSTIFEYNYSEKRPGKRQNYLTMSASVEPAGNLSYGIARLASPDTEAPYRLLGLPFAQFLRVETGVKYHWYNKHTDWLARLNIGVAQPYGNGMSIPYIRQFFVGGSNSIRAWQIRTLGPGAVPVEALDAATFQDQTGDLKLEANLEYRFPIISYLKGAAFVDAGNIWLVDQGPIDADQEDGVFQWNEFYRQIAIGGGLGLRLDISYFVLRLDVAFPFRKPYNAAGNRWVFDEFAPGSTNWRAENIVYNLAIGYPF